MKAGPRRRLPEHLRCVGRRRGPRRHRRSGGRHADVGVFGAAGQAIIEPGRPDARVGRHAPGRRQQADATAMPICRAKPGRNRHGANAQPPTQPGLGDQAPSRNHHRDSADHPPQQATPRWRRPCARAQPRATRHGRPCKVEGRECPRSISSLTVDLGHSRPSTVNRNRHHKARPTAAGLKATRTQPGRVSSRAWETTTQPGSATGPENQDAARPDQQPTGGTQDAAPPCQQPTWGTETEPGHTSSRPGGT